MAGLTPYSRRIMCRPTTNRSTYGGRSSTFVAPFASYHSARTQTSSSAQCVSGADGGQKCSSSKSVHAFSIPIRSSLAIFLDRHAWTSPMRACHRCHAKLTFCALRAGSRACSDDVYRGRLDGVDSGEHLGIAGRVCGVTGQRCGVIIG